MRLATEVVHGGKEGGETSRARPGEPRRRGPRRLCLSLSLWCIQLALSSCAQSPALRARRPITDLRRRRSARRSSPRSRSGGATAPSQRLLLFGAGCKGDPTRLRVALVACAPYLRRLGPSLGEGQLHPPVFAACRLIYRASGCESSRGRSLASYHPLASVSSRHALGCRSLVLLGARPPLA